MGRSKPRGQAAIEYFVIAAMVMMFMIPIWVYISSTQQSTSFELSLSYAQNTAKQLTDASNLVHSQGAPAKINIKVYIPSGVENISIEDRILKIFVNTGSQTTEVWYASSSPLTAPSGIPVNEGYYYFDIISHDTYVEINRTS